MASQFDSALGGDEDLPSHVNLQQYIHKRAKEVAAMSSTLQSSTSTKLVFQRLPTHMRRRIMSHNVKRLPRRLRHAHTTQFSKSGMPPKQKRPSRKYRRRPQNLLEEYRSRQRNVLWLETHIWHAKRFHMVTRWGYRLPDRPCDKAFRACYRASAQHCLLQDISYINCVEIIGPISTLEVGFKCITNSVTGLSITAKAYICGKREGSTFIYHPNSFPLKSVGKVSFVWKPEDSNTRTVWLWAHTAYYDEVVEVLKLVFNLQKVSEDKYLAENLVVNILKHSLNRFRLTGPLANSVLQNALKTPSDPSALWLTTYLQNEQNLQAYIEQNSYWNSLKGCLTAELPPHLVLSLVVVDPRFNFPRKRTKALPDQQEFNAACEITYKQHSPIWDKAIRDTIVNEKLSALKVTELRNVNFVPEEQSRDKYCLPVLVLQQPGHEGYNAGWDVVIPSGWALPVWLCLILWGARAGGLRESYSTNFESGLADLLPPDTEAGAVESQRIEDDLKQKYFRLPPNKRINYNKLAVTSPFRPQWKLLLSEWGATKSRDEFYVLRDRKVLAQLQKGLADSEKLHINTDLFKNVLVPVRLLLSQKGTPEQFALICLAKKSDYKLPYEEPLNKDENQSKRKQLRDFHKKMLKRLRQRRVRAKKAGKKLPTDVELIRKHAEKMRSLWLPESDKIRNLCSRQIIGYVTSGGFSFTKAQGAAVGYVTFMAFLSLLEAKRKEVLIRNVNCRQYKLAKVSVICSL